MNARTRTVVLGQATRGGVVGLALRAREAWACSPGPEAADAMLRSELISLGSFLLCVVALLWQAVARKQVALRWRLLPFALLPLHPLFLLSGLETSGDCGASTALVSTIVAGLVLAGFALLAVRRRSAAPKA